MYFINKVNQTSEHSAFPTPKMCLGRFYIYANVDKNMQIVKHKQQPHSNVYM